MVRQQQEQRHFLGHFDCRPWPDLAREKNRINPCGYGPVLAIFDGDCGCMDTGGCLAEKKEIIMNLTDSIVEKELLPEQSLVPNCFCCGLENPSGLRMRFFKEGPTAVSTEFTPPEFWTGWGQMMHGGFHSLLLDETMAWVVFGLLNENAFVTREMTIRYHRPVFVSMPLKIFGYLVEDAGRKIIVRGEIQDESGNVLTSAVATLIRLDPQHMEIMLA
jgi:acyl-coenzyme A thioesterase PaaI-like protein